MYSTVGTLTIIEAWVLSNVIPKGSVLDENDCHEVSRYPVHSLKQCCLALLACMQRRAMRRDVIHENLET